MKIRTFIPMVGIAIEAGDSTRLIEAINGLLSALHSHENAHCTAGGVCNNICMLFRAIGESSEQYLNILAESHILLVFCGCVPICLTVQGISDIQALRMRAVRNKSNSWFGVILVEAPRGPETVGEPVRDDCRLPGSDGRITNILRILCKGGPNTVKNRHVMSITDIPIDSVPFISDLNNSITEMSAKLASSGIRGSSGILSGMVVKP
jgi:hypothetical protein